MSRVGAWTGVLLCIVSVLVVSVGLWYVATRPTHCRYMETQDGQTWEMLYETTGECWK